MPILHWIMPLIKSLIRKLRGLLAYKKARLPEKARPPIIPTVLRNDRLDQYIWVYQPGRVASGSIVESIYRCGLKALHCHYLSETTLKQLDDVYAEDRIPTVKLNNILVQKHFYELFRNLLQHNPPSASSHYKIITLTREPISHLVSYYFYNYNSFFRIFVEKKYGNATASTIQKHFTECIRVYMSLYNANPKGSADTSWKDVKDADLRYFMFLARTYFFWFERELQAFFGCNVFNEPFDIQAGYHIYQDRNVSVLLLRFEDFFDIGESVIRDFLGRPSFSLVSANVSKNQPHYDVYQNFAASYKMPVEFVQHLHNSPMARHFYSDEELDQDFISS